LPEINIFLTTIIPLRISLTVIYHHSLHHEFFPQGPQLPLRRCILLTYRFLIYVA